MFTLQLTAIDISVAPRELLGPNFMRDIAAELEWRGEKIIRDRVDRGDFMGGDPTYSTRPLWMKMNATKYGSQRAAEMDSYFRTLHSMMQIDKARFGSAGLFRGSEGRSGRFDPQGDDKIRRVATRGSGTWLRFEHGYKEFRSRLGLPSSRVNLRLTGHMMRDLTVQGQVGKKSGWGRLMRFNLNKVGTHASGYSVTRKTAHLHQWLILEAGFVTEESARIAQYHHEGTVQRRHHTERKVGERRGRNVYRGRRASRPIRPFALFTAQENELLAEFANRLVGESIAIGGGGRNRRGQIEKHQVARGLRMVYKVGRG